MDQLREVLVQGWGIRAVSSYYIPEGGGSHHWRVVDESGHRHFVTVDDLDDKDWLGNSRDAVWAGLRQALATAAVLRSEAHLDYVVAPVAALDGGILRRLGDVYAISVYPSLTGISYPFGSYTDTELRNAVLTMVAELHRSTPVVRDRAPRHEPTYGGRQALDDFLAEPDLSWTGGPFSEPAHRLLSRHVPDLRELADGFTVLVEQTAPSRSTTVITHGEPHPANLMTVDDRLMMIDWDTAALAPPERDLSLITPTPCKAAESYERASGHAVDFAIIDLYRLRWYLDDLASAVRLFRRGHTENLDTRHWWQGLAPRLEQLPKWLESLA